MLPVPNLVTEGEDFYISYNCRDSNIYGGDTTALVQGDMEHFYILNGDHRGEYEALVPQGFQACYQYFLEHKQMISKYSE